MKAPGLLLLALGSLAAQIPNPTQQAPAQRPVETGQPAPVFRVTVVSRNIQAVNYRHRSGSTEVNLRGTELMPAARGEAKVRSEMGSTKVETKIDRMGPANQFGPEYLTYVLWAITPEGRAANLGELVLDGNDAKLLSTTELQAFGLIVTAEPYFAVTQPSDVVVAENFISDATRGKIQPIQASYELLQRGEYVFNRAAYKPVQIDPKGPLQLAQAENAVEIARLAGADRYAPETYQRALTSLQNARDFLGRNRNRKSSETNARAAAQFAEDARIITIRKMREEQLAAERAAAAEREAAERQKALEASEAARREQERRAQAEAEQRAAEQARVAAEVARREAEQAAARAARERAAADAARAAAIEQQRAAEAEAERARMSAMEAERERQRAEAERVALRERLRQQLNTVLETRESQRGLIVNISDVLFDFNKYTLKPGAREKLAKVAGILLAYPGLKVQLEGHTDNVGSDEYNLKLSEQRADAVRSYLVAQGVPASEMTARGLGEADPVAGNETAEGRQRNRRVDMVVAGQPIGVETPTASTADRDEQPNVVNPR